MTILSVMNVIFSNLIKNVLLNGVARTLKRLRTSKGDYLSSNDSLQ